MPAFRPPQNLFSNRRLAVATKIHWSARTKLQPRRIAAPLTLRQVRASLARDALGFGASPCRDLGVVAREKHIGNRAALPFARAGIVRVLEQALFEAFLRAGLLLTHHAGDEPHAGVENRERGDFASRQHIVADRHLDEATRRDHALVDALEARTENDETGSRRPLPRLSLRERAPARAHDQAGARIVRADRRIEARAQNISPHHHAGAAARRGIVDRPMAAKPMFAYVARVERPQASRQR